MIIKKMYQGTAPENKIVGTYTESDTDTYNCNYVNKHLQWNKGDTISFPNAVFVGVSGMSGGTLYFDIPLGKPLNSSITASDITITINGACSVRYGGNAPTVTQLTVQDVFNSSGNIRACTNNINMPVNTVGGLFGIFDVVINN